MAEPEEFLKTLTDEFRIEVPEGYIYTGANPSSVRLWLKRQFGEEEPSSELAATLQFIIIASLIGPKKAKDGLGAKAGKFKPDMVKAVGSTTGLGQFSAVSSARDRPNHASVTRRLVAELSERHGHVQRPAAEPFFDRGSRGGGTRGLGRSLRRLTLAACGLGGDLELLPSTVVAAYEKGRYLLNVDVAMEDEEKRCAQVGNLALSESLRRAKEAERPGLRPSTATSEEEELRSDEKMEEAAEEEEEERRRGLGTPETTTASLEWSSRLPVFHQLQLVFRAGRADTVGLRIGVDQLGGLKQLDESLMLHVADYLAQQFPDGIAQAFQPFKLYPGPARDCHVLFDTQRLSARTRAVAVEKSSVRQVQPIQRISGVYSHDGPKPSSSRFSACRLRQHKRADKLRNQK
eukprot:Skav208676  [mRNA]  locus=scaffold775:170115:181631:+ [translate_table: standard]